MAMEAAGVGDSGGVRDGQRRGMCEKSWKAQRRRMKGKAGRSWDALCFFPLNFNNTEMPKNSHATFFFPVEKPEEGKSKALRLTSKAEFF